MTTPRRKPPGTAAVSLCRERATWLVDGPDGPLHGQADVRGEGVDALVAAIEAAREAAGAPLDPIVLALGRGLVAHELLRVPPLPKRELGEVFSRRTAKTLGAARDEVAFTAFCSGEDDSPRREKEQCWTVAAVRRAELTALCLQLRDRGISVRRVVSARLASLAAARRALADTERPAVLVAIEPTAITLSLCRGEAVLNQDAIDGDFLNNPAIASSLIHQIKSVIGFWKKESRGEQVKQLALFGLHPERAAVLKHAIEDALGGVTVVFAPAEAEHAMDGAFAHLRAAQVADSFNPDLSVPLPPRRTTVAAAVAVAVLAIAGGGLTAAERVGAEVRALNSEAGRLAESSRALPGLSAANARAESTLASLAVQTERLRAIRARGIPAEDLFTTALAALHGRAELGDFDVRSDRRGVATAVISGSVGADPSVALASLSEVLRALERSGRLADLRLELPDQLPDDRPGERMAFQIRGSVRTQRGSG